MLARYLVLLSFLPVAAGCALSHERGLAAAPSAARTDAGAPVSVRDAGVTATDGGAPPETCAGASGSVSVELSAGDGAHCSSAFAGQLRRIEAAPNGVRIVVDPCFLDETECPCTVTVHGVGDDVATSIGATYGWVEVQLTDRAVFVDEPGPCRCATIGCCPGPLVFYANDGSLELPPFAPTAPAFGVGSTICEESTCRRAARVQMSVPSSPDAPMGAIAEAAAGETTAAAFLALRVLRAARVATCGADVATTAAWAAWALPLPGG